MYDKEAVYDNEIAPLLEEIIKICKREDLPMVAQFYLKQEREDASYENQAMYCTTVLNYFEGIYPEHKKHLSYVSEAMKYGSNGKPFIFSGVIK